MKSTTVFVLFAAQGNLTKSYCYGVYTSKKSLKAAVEKHMKDDPHVPKYTLFFEEWKMNNSNLVSWDWAYIPVTQENRNLKRGHAVVPIKKFWGMNLIGAEWFVESGYCSTQQKKTEKLTISQSN